MHFDISKIWSETQKEHNYTGHELNQAVKCEGSLLEGKRKHNYIVMMMKRCGIKAYNGK